MKKIISLLILLSLTLLSLVACGEPEDDTKIRVGYMAGPTGMGMAKLIHDNGGAELGNEKYSFKKYADTEAAKRDLTKGEIDVICIPTNEAATYYMATDDNNLVLAVNTLNTLYLLTDGSNTVTQLSDLANKTVYTCSNGTPNEIVEHLFETAKIEVTVSTSFEGSEIKTPAQLGALIIAGKLDYAVVPEPIVTSALLQNNSYSVDLNIGTEWKNICKSEIAMGCLYANKTFVQKHPKAINAFLDEYKASVEFISKAENRDTAAEYVVETGIMAAAAPAKKALANLGDSITYIEGAEMKAMLVTFYKAVGINAPQNKNFYYER
ncbi:MAG: ABC transporter substrate-binding protein [Clostridia bacterium]|nr:ABC transporter substrate-binding protein [Clostridia bacterium]